MGGIVIDTGIAVTGPFRITETACYQYNNRMLTVNEIIRAGFYIQVLIIVPVGAMLIIKRIFLYPEQAKVVLISANISANITKQIYFFITIIQVNRTISFWCYTLYKSCSNTSVCSKLLIFFNRILMMPALPLVSYFALGWLIISIASTSLLLIPFRYAARSLLFNWVGFPST